MSKSKAIVYIRLKEGVLDPQGKTIAHAMSNMGYTEFESVRSGRFFELECETRPDLEKRIDEISRKLLSNPIIETYRVEMV
ncbi:MAG: phosphoribosylformylglycinamidine synthase subunit PurS [candidate division Zixibacteria bacterium]|nr:phosphoribosylformylglycinamidine synthase subunit PurS [candidate division Zixibacteria bacterium]